MRLEDRIELARVVTLTARLAAAEARVAEMEAALREIADECECDFPRCQSNLARRALEVQP